MLNNEIHCPGHRSVVKDFLFLMGVGVNMAIRDNIPRKHGHLHLKH